jgi:hypothetical protein
MMPETETGEADTGPDRRTITDKCQVERIYQEASSLVCVILQFFASRSGIRFDNSLCRAIIILPGERYLLRAGENIFDKE